MRKIVLKERLLTIRTKDGSAFDLGNRQVGMENRFVTDTDEDIGTECASALVHLSDAIG
jgi:hypothetical protein